jgi:hypothetical protein
MSDDQKSRKLPGSGAKVAKTAPKRNVYRDLPNSKPAPPDKSMPKDRVKVK